MREKYMFYTSVPLIWPTLQSDFSSTFCNQFFSWRYIYICGKSHIHYLRKRRNEHSIFFQCCTKGRPVFADHLAVRAISRNVTSGNCSRKVLWKITALRSFSEKKKAAKHRLNESSVMLPAIDDSTNKIKVCLQWNLLSVSLVLLPCFAIWQWQSLSCQSSFSFSISI